ncbi:Uncharacterised protein [Serratia marcescens]|nr:Uncharacterised protein [Serratia marcescens]
MLMLLIMKLQNNTFMSACLMNGAFHVGSLTSITCGMKSNYEKCRQGKRFLVGFNYSRQGEVMGRFITTIHL